MDISSSLRTLRPYLITAAVGLFLGWLIVVIYVLPQAPTSPVESVSVPRPRAPEKLLPVQQNPSVEDILPEVTAPPVAEPPPSVTTIIIPSLVGRDLWDVQQTLKDMNLIVIVRKDTSSFELPNTVLRQTPQAGQRMFRNDTVYITISEFP